MRCLKALRFLAYVPEGVSIPFPFRPGSKEAEGTAVFRRTEAAAWQRESAASNAGFFFLPKMDYPTHQGVPPAFSASQLHHHHDVVHRYFVEELNRSTIGTGLEGQPLDVVIRASAFDATLARAHVAACEHFNHCLFWKSIKPWGTDVPRGILDALHSSFSSSHSRVASKPDVMRVVLQRFLQAGADLHSDGWLWLVSRQSKLDVWSCQRGQSPIAYDLIPLLCMDVSYHAYYIDYDMSKDDSAPGSGSKLETPIVLESRMQFIRNLFLSLDWRLADSIHTKLRGQA